MMTTAVDYAFVHGGAQGSWVWQDTIQALDLQTRGDFGRAWALDVPGCGVKRGATDALTIEDVARELVEDIERAGLRDVVLVGHSQGGQAMAFMVAQRPDLFRRLVYVTCSIPLPGQTVLEMMGRGPQGSNDDEIGWPGGDQAGGGGHGADMFGSDLPPDRTRQLVSQLGADSWPAQTYAGRNWPLDHLGEVPATYVICLRDRMLPVAWQERFAERFGAERRVRIDAGHQVMNSRPHALAEVLRSEARGIDGKGPSSPR